MKKRREPKIEIPIVPMLDMAFQLLTFFIMTYRPAPSEVQFNMNLLPPAPAAKMSAEPPPPDSSAPSDAPAALRTLTTTLRAGEGGSLGAITLGDNDVNGLEELAAQLELILKDPNLGFEQALLQVDPNLNYAELVAVIDVFSRLGLTKVSFTELPAGI